MAESAELKDHVDLVVVLVLYLALVLDLALILYLALVMDLVLVMYLALVVDLVLVLDLALVENLVLVLVLFLDLVLVLHLALVVDLALILYLTLVVDLVLILYLALVVDLALILYLVLVVDLVLVLVMVWWFFEYCHDCCLDKKRVCDPWARLGFCERRKSFMKKNCPRRCDVCYEPPEAVSTPTPPPPNVRVKLVPRGKVVAFRCGTRNSVSAPKISWFKDGEQIQASVPGYIIMKDRDLRIVVNEFNEGIYTCQIQRRGDSVSANSWAIRLKPDTPSIS